MTVRRTGAAAGFSVACVALVAWSVWSYAATRRLERAIAGVRERHEPVTLDELRAEVGPIEPSSDAARLYRAALELVISPGHEVRVARSEALTRLKRSPAVTLDVSAPLAPNAEALALYDKASAMSECRFSWRPETDSVLPIHALANAGSLRTLQRAGAADGEAAAASLVRSLRFLRVFDSDRMALTALLKAALLERAVRDLEVVLERTEPSDGALAELQKAFGSVVVDDELRRTIMGERAYGMSTSMTEIASLSFWERPSVRWQMARHVEGFSMPRVSIDDAEQVSAASPSSMGFSSRWLVFLMSTSIERMTGLSRCAVTAVAIERRTRYQGLPDSLAQLVPSYLEAVPLDPVDGRELRYMPSANGYRVASVGRDVTSWTKNSTPPPEDSPGAIGVRVRRTAGTERPEKKKRAH